jgi:hypothetical protein
MVEVDLNGKRVTLSEEEVRWLIAQGTAQAGFSSQRRDLALIFKRACSTDGAPKLVVLRRFEARTLEALLRERAPAAA